MAESKLAKAAFVGAKTVKVPVPLRVLTRSGYLVRAVTNVVKSGLPWAKPTMSCVGATLLSSSLQLDNEKENRKTRANTFVNSPEMNGFLVTVVIVEFCLNV
jgi:hypothetical protein